MTDPSPLQSLPDRNALPPLGSCDPDDPGKRTALTTLQEQVFCERYARDCFTNRGHVVELGPWLGSLTRHIQRGLARNEAYRENPRPLHAYDQFIWKPWCEEQVKGTQLAGKLPLESSFRGEFLRRVDHPCVPVTAHAVDLRQPGYPVPDSIEFLVNDALKGWTMARHFATAMLPRLLPGGCLAHQDFLWPTESFLIPLMFHFREYFHCAYALPDSCMAVFVRKSTQPAFPQTLPSLPKVLARQPTEFFNDAFQWVRDSLQGLDEEVLWLCKAVLLFILDHREAACKVVAEHQLATIQGSRLFAFQRSTLRQWRFAELLSPSSAAL